jgi:multiple sugar transport system permease protein
VTRPGLTVSRIFAYTFLGTLALVSLLPFYTTLVSATLAYGGGVSFLPDRFLIRNLTDLVFRASEYFPFSRSYGNSLFIALTTTVLTGYFGVFTAYGFALYSFRGKKLLWGLLLALMMVPQTVSLLGFYKLTIAFDMINTYWPLILPGMANSYVVFYLRQYLQTTVPASLLEAARIDGAGEMALFHKLILPNVLPGMAPILIIVFLQSWNSYLIPLLILNEDHLKTLPIVFASIRSASFAGLAAAFSMLTMVALVAVFLRFLRPTNAREGLNG